MKFEVTKLSAANYLKIADGETVRGVFAGEPHKFYCNWKDNRSTECPGRNICAECISGLKAGFRFEINFIIKENGTYSAKIWEQGWRTFEALMGFNEGGYPLESHQMKITRTGSGKNTAYNIMPIPDGKLNDKQQKALSEVKLNEFETTSEKVDKAHEKVVKNSSFEPVEEETIPF